MKRVIRWSCYGLGLAIGLLCLLYFFFPSRWVARHISDALTKKLVWVIRIDEIRPFPLGSLAIGPVHVTEPDGSPFMSLERFSVSYRVMPLLRGELHVGEILLDRPAITLRRKGEAWSFEDLLHRFPPPETPPPPSPLASVDIQQIALDQLWPKIVQAFERAGSPLPVARIERAKVRDFVLTYDDSKRKKIALPPITLLASLALKPPSEGHFAAEWSTPSSGEPTFETQGKLEADFPTGHFSAHNIQLNVSRWIHVALQGELKRFGLDRFDLSSNVTIDPSGGTTALAAAVRDALSLSDTPLLNIDANAEGKLTRLSLADISKAVASLSPPIDLITRGSIRARGIPRSLLPHGMSLPEAALSWNIRTDSRNFMAKSSMSLAGLTLPPSTTGNIPLPPLTIREEGAVTLADLKQIKFDAVQLSIPTLGFKASLDGSVNSDIVFPRLAEHYRKGEFRELRKSLMFLLTADVDVDSGKIPSVTPGLRLDGKLSGRARLEKSDDRSLHVTLTGDAKTFSAALGKEFEIKDVDFHVPLARLLSLGGLPPSTDRPSVWGKSYMSDVRTLSPFAGAFHADLIRSGNHILRNVGIDFGLDASTLVLDRLTADVLGGSAWGRGSLSSTGDQLEISFALEGVDLDTAQLTAAASEGDAKISADLSAHLALRSGKDWSAESVLDDLDGQFHITRVGDQTLDRLIVFLDPEGSNPTLVQARGLLKNRTVASNLSNPLVNVAIHHGVIDAELVLPSVKMVDVRVPVRNISVKNILKLGAVRSSIEGLLPLLALTRYLHVKGIDDQGALVFASENVRASRDK